MPDVWFSYECDGSACPSRPGTGVILDVRIPGVLANTGIIPVVACPLCASPMHLRDYWPASESGHGSRSSADAQGGENRE